MRLNYFLKMFKISFPILKMQENIEKKSLNLKINAVELVEVNSMYYGENTWHRQSVG